ncbi:CCHC-type domain-containing protein [Trichonephila clavata]|uniref:CCHC-type domain-containing protein n=1 Tax=Trichonephila clavata TaxID=2740835 RepID=A0A8X6KQ36_TRICU|nr:CCHC-type domain-containing protein [Trichonephila clavata]
MLDSETATHIGVLQWEEWYKPKDLGKQCDIFYASKEKSYDAPARAKWNDSEKKSFTGSWGKQPFGEKKSDSYFSSRKNFDKPQIPEIKKFTCFTCGSDKHFKRDCPKNKGMDNKRLNVNKVSTEGMELENGKVAARVDLLGKVIPRRNIEDKLSKLVKISIRVDGKLVQALVDSGSLDESEVSSGILLEKAQKNIEDSQGNITSCRNEVGTIRTKDEEVIAEMDKGSMVADSFRSEQECCVELALAWKHANEGKGNYYEVTSLATPDANLPFQVHCDASDYDVGCCLTQQDTDGVYMPIAFASQKFTAKQKNWASIEKEAWAVLYGLNKFDRWIYGAKVEIISDHNPLKYLNQMTPKSPKLTRWALALQRWNHSITHRPGIQHRSADALSRLR